MFVVGVLLFNPSLSLLNIYSALDGKRGGEDREDGERHRGGGSDR